MYGWTSIHEVKFTQDNVIERWRSSIVRCNAIGILAKFEPLQLRLSFQANDRVHRAGKKDIDFKTRQQARLRVQPIVQVSRCAAGGGEFRS